MSIFKELIGDEYCVGDFFALNVCKGEIFKLENGYVEVVEAFDEDEAEKYDYALTSVKVVTDDTCTFSMIWSLPEGGGIAWDFDGFGA